MSLASASGLGLEFWIWMIHEPGRHQVDSIWKPKPDELSIPRL